MIHSTIIATAATVLGLFTLVSHAVNIVNVQGQDFVDTTTGNRFEVLGVDYQPGGEAAFGPGFGDPLSNATTCLRDAALMQSLGFNTVRVYNIDPTLDHDACVSIFNAVGIYLILDLNSPLSGGSVSTGDPAGTYTLDYLTSRPFAMVEAFKNYPNLLGFFAANELVNTQASDGIDPPYIRAVQRDTKNYVAKHASRAIPVGYSAADIRPVVPDQLNYLQCSIPGETNDTSRSDFIGLNSYSWCSGDDFHNSSYDQLVSIFSNTSTPVFFSEYGCNQNIRTPRQFDEVPVIYGPQMSVFSGGLVYEWTQESNGLGLVLVNSNCSMDLLQDYDNLQSQFSALNISEIEAKNSTATSLTAPICSASLITSSGFNTNWTLPAPPAGAEAVIASGISNPNIGNLTQVTCPVYATNGQQINNLAIKPLSGGSGNTPGAASTASGSGSGATTTGSSSGSGSKSSGAAVPLRTGMMSGLLAVGVAIGGVLV